MRITKELAILLVDIVVALVGHFGAKYLAPGIHDDVIFVIGVAQPAVLLWIGYLYANRKVREVRASVEMLAAQLRRGRE